MHSIEPHYNWRHVYRAEDDPRSPFYQKEYNEMAFTHTVYNHYIHPQWDSIDSATLYLKLLYTNYDIGFCIIELMGEWNDTLYNDGMFLKRNFIDYLIEEGIDKFILIGENILNFHSSDIDYYEEWFDDIEDGWISCINFRDHIADEIKMAHMDYYMAIGGDFDDIPWRSLGPLKVFERVQAMISKRLCT